MRIVPKTTIMGSDCHLHDAALDLVEAAVADGLLD